MPVVLYKPRSETPFESVKKYRVAHPELEKTKIGYAGRLDPMAEGILLLLVGDENKKRKEFEKLDKEYEFDVLLGLETDTFDVMGMFVEFPNDKSVTRADFEFVLERFRGTWMQKYPRYSSAVVRGKPLYWWVRQKRIDEIIVPSKEIEIKELELTAWREVKAADVAQEAINRIRKVNGDFRQREIIKQWQAVVTGQSQVCLSLATCRIVCSSGTYVRGLAHSLGRALNTPALAYSIKRTRVGQFEM